MIAVLGKYSLDIFLWHIFIQRVLSATILKYLGIYGLGELFIIQRCLCYVLLGDICIIKLEIICANQKT